MWDAKLLPPRGVRWATLSDNDKVVTGADAENWTSVRGSSGFSTGVHVWELEVVHVSKISVHVSVGLVDESFNTWEDGVIGFHQPDHSYGLDGEGNPYGDWKADNMFPAFACDVLRCTLDLGARTFMVENVTQNGAKYVACPALPAGRTFFPAVTIMRSDTSVRICSLSAKAEMLLTVHCGEPHEDGTIPMLITNMAGEEVANINAALAKPVSELKATVAKELQGEAIRLMLSDGQLFTSDMNDEPLGSVLG